jgi:hypothetical protein
MHDYESLNVNTWIEWLSYESVECIIVCVCVCVCACACVCVCVVNGVYVSSHSLRSLNK